MSLTDWKLWAHGLVAALIGGTSTAISGAFADPAAFNLTPDGIHRLGKLAIGGGILGAVAYLKQSPLPCKPQVAADQK